MKKLSLALACLALTACGNTPKNEVAKTIPAPQRLETQKEFEARCLISDSNGPRGQFNADRSLCRKVSNTVYFAGTEDADYEQKEPSKDHILKNGVGPGALVMGNFDGNAVAPEVTLDATPVARGNLNTPYVTERAGDIHLTTYAGTYKRLNYSLSFCFGRGNDSAPCRGF